MQPGVAEVDLPVAGSRISVGALQLAKLNIPARSKGTPSLLSAVLVSAWSNEPEIAGRFQLYSMKFTTEAWSLRLWSTLFCLAHGEMTISGGRGPNPHRPCWPPSGEQRNLDRGDRADPARQGRERGAER